jgi:cytochrome c1
MRGDAERGRAALLALECNVCHEIPGVSGAPGYVGPSLAAYGRKVYVAGKFPNTPEILVQWIMDAPALAPATAMPAFAQVSETQAYDIAAYLHSLR